MRATTLKPVFVRSIPEKLEEGNLYISMEYGTVVHKCCCGCGSEVVTPLGPTEWKLTYDGTVSLHPSVGSWNLPCRSHYWIHGNSVRSAAQWSDKQIAAARAHENATKAAHYGSRGQRERVETTVPAASTKCSIWTRLWRSLWG